MSEYKELSSLINSAKSFIDKYDFKHKHWKDKKAADVFPEWVEKHKKMAIVIEERYNKWEAEIHCLSPDRLLEVINPRAKVTIIAVIPEGDICDLCSSYSKCRYTLNIVK